MSYRVCIVEQDGVYLSRLSQFLREKENTVLDVVSCMSKEEYLQIGESFDAVLASETVGMQEDDIESGVLCYLVMTGQNLDERKYSKYQSLENIYDAVVAVCEQNAPHKQADNAYEAASTDSYAQAPVLEPAKTPDQYHGAVATYELPIGKTFDTAILQKMKTDSVKGLLKVANVDETGHTMDFQVEDLVQLTRCHLNSSKQVVKIMKNLLDTILGIEEQGFDMDNIVLDPMKIYIDEDTFMPLFMYSPVVGKLKTVDYMAALSEILGTFVIIKEDEQEEEEQATSVLFNAQTAPQMNTQSPFASSNMTPNMAPAMKLNMAPNMTSTQNMAPSFASNMNANPYNIPLGSQTQTQTQTQSQTQTPAQSQPFMQSQTSAQSQPFMQSQTQAQSKPFMQSQTSAQSQPYMQTQTPAQSQPFMQTQTPAQSQPFMQSQTPAQSQPFMQNQTSAQSQPYMQSNSQIQQQPQAYSQPQSQPQHKEKKGLAALFSRKNKEHNNTIHYNPYTAPNGMPAQNMNQQNMNQNNGNYQNMNSQFRPAGSPQMGTTPVMNSQFGQTPFNATKVQGAQTPVNATPAQGVQTPVGATPAQGVQRPVFAQPINQATSGPATTQMSASSAQPAINNNIVSDSNVNVGQIGEGQAPAQGDTSVFSSGVPLRSINEPAESKPAVEEAPMATTLLNEALLDERKAYLIRTKDSQKIAINRDVFKVGKEHMYVDYCVDDNPAISRSHADILKIEGQYYICDNGSSNHTFVNGRMIPDKMNTLLENGCKITLANEDFTFVIE